MAEYLLELPTSEFPNYSYTTGLDGKEYKIQFLYHIRTNSWYLYIYETDGTALLSGARLVPWIDILYGYSKEELPLGNLYLVPISTEYPSSSEITLENLSTDFELVYNSVN